MVVEYEVEGAPFKLESAALEHARCLAKATSDVRVWMRSGSWLVLIARYIGGVESFPVPRGPAKYRAA